LYAKKPLSVSIKLNYTLQKYTIPVSFTMSKASDVIVLAPIKGSDLIKEYKAQDPTTDASGRYVPPSKRAEEAKEVKPLSAEQLDSQTNFPSLPSTKPMTKSISWAELRSRLNSKEEPSTPQPDISMKAMIEDSIKKQEMAEEQAQRAEEITDPFLMTRDHRSREGWEVLNINPNNRKAWFAKSSFNRPSSEYVEEPYAWPNPVLTFSANKTQSLLHPFYADGRPLR
jgi:hypothetical protein